MNKFSKTLAAILGAATLATSPMSANAASFKTAPVLTLNDGVVIDVHRRRYRHRHSRRGRGGGVAAGIIGGIILGGIIAESSRSRHRRSHRRDNLHLDWCYRRYRSYRAYDNTFQPYRGRRRPCFSPYY